MGFGRQIAQRQLVRCGGIGIHFVVQFLQRQESTIQVSQPTYFHRDHTGADFVEERQGLAIQRRSKSRQNNHLLTLSREYQTIGSTIAFLRDTIGALGGHYYRILTLRAARPAIGQNACHLFKVLNERKRLCQRSASGSETLDGREITFTSRLHTHLVACAARQSAERILLSLDTSYGYPVFGSRLAVLQVVLGLCAIPCNHSLRVCDLRDCHCRRHRALRSEGNRSCPFALFLSRTSRLNLYLVFATGCQAAQRICRCYQGLAFLPFVASYSAIAQIPAILIAAGIPCYHCAG